MSSLKLVPSALALGTERMCRDASIGVKQISVRTGHRGFVEGNLLVLYNEEYGYVATATIDSVRHCILSEVTEEECHNDGFVDQNALLLGLREFYGDSITLNSDVTVLSWGDVQGPQADKYRETAASI